LVKWYDPTDWIEYDGKHLSVNGDDPLIEDGSGIKIDELETGGLILKTEATLQNETAYISVEEVPTAVDAYTPPTYSKIDGKWNKYDEVKPIDISTEFALREYTDTDEYKYVKGINCNIDYYGNIAGIPSNEIIITTLNGNEWNRIISVPP
jgi:hypothetical protein